MVAGVLLHARPFLTELRGAFASDPVRDAGCRHKVSLVGRVDEGCARESGPADGRDAPDAAVLKDHAVFAVQPFVTPHVDAVLRDESLKDLLRRMGLENPHRALLAVDGGRALAAVAVFLALLPLPGVEGRVVLPDAVVKLAGEAPRLRSYHRYP